MPELSHARRFREPMFNVPGVVLGIFAVLLFVHAARVFLGDFAFIWDFAFIPARISVLFGFDPVQTLTDQLAVGPDTPDLQERLALARELALDGTVKPWTLLTYALLHASWAHLLLNSIWMLAFGSAVARRFGTGRFLAFMALASVAGAFGHLITHTEDVAPMVGASGAISGCMAAATRFAFQPGAPLGPVRMTGDDAYRIPAHPLRDVLRDSRALTFTLVWLMMNFATGLGSGSMELIDASIAWQAHLGGFVFGLLAFPLFDPVPRHWGEI